jgi:exoribonuclease II
VWREKNGAITIDLPSCDVHVSGAGTESPHVTLTPDLQNLSPSRRLVAEMMILAGELAGRFGGDRALALPYRGQAEPVLPTDDPLWNKLPDDSPCRALMMRQ